MPYRNTHPMSTLLKHKICDELYVPAFSVCSASTLDSDYCDTCLKILDLGCTWANERQFTTFQRKCTDTGTDTDTSVRR